MGLTAAEKTILRPTGKGDGLVQTWGHNERRPIPLFLIPAEGGA